MAKRPCIKCGKETEPYRSMQLPGQNPVHNALCNECQKKLRIKLATIAISIVTIYILWHLFHNELRWI